jgi:hypothetical protein
MRTTSLILGALIATTASAAHADQCATSPRSVADKAAELVKKGATVLEFCEPCRDAAPGKPYVVQSVAAKDGKLFVNGRDVDLAYLFVKTGPDELKNVGLLAQCGASDVSEKITGGKPSGPIKSRPPSTLPGGRPMPPSPPRPSSAAELGGEWNVRLSTRYSSCMAIAPPAYSEWSITYAAGALVLKSNDGTELAGTIDNKPPSSLFKATLKPRQRPSSAALQLTMFVKDRFSGMLIRTEKSSNLKDPVCVIYQDIQATRR